MPCISSQLDQMMKLSGSYSDVVEKICMVRCAFYLKRDFFFFFKFRTA